MNDAVYEILDRAKTVVLDGERNASEAISEAFNDECIYSWVLWELMKEVYNPEDVLRGDFGAEGPYIALYDYVHGEISDEVEDFIQENTWTVHYCDGPTEDDEYDYEEYATEDDFLEEVALWTVIRRDEKEAWLYEPEDEED